MSQVHAIALQMVANRMVEFVVTDKTKLGTEAMSKANVSIKTTVTNFVCDEKTYTSPTYVVDER